MKISIHKYIPNLLEDGNLDKQDAMAQSVDNFKSKQVYDIQKLAFLVCKDVVYAPIYFRGNYLKKENAILTMDLIIFDVDNDTTMDEVLDSKLGQNYEVLLLKTVSCTAKKEKFRVFIPLQIPISFSDSFIMLFSFIFLSFYCLWCSFQDNALLETVAKSVSVC